MNRETEELKHRLEQATSASMVDPGTLDEETALLRESWQALSRLLAHERTVSRPEVVSAVVTKVRLDRPTAARGKSSGMWLLGCAASALTILALWLLRPTLVSQEEGPQVARSLRSGENAISEDPAPRSPSGGSGSPGELAWEDSWESDFTRSALVVQRFHTVPAGDRSLSRLQDDFSELARDVESSSL